MRALLQRVGSAAVSVDNQTIGEISAGLLVYVGVKQTDTKKDASLLAQKVANLRIFEDQAGKLNLSVLDKSKQILVVPNFTLQADARKGRRPSFTLAAGGEFASDMFDFFISELKNAGCLVETGKFGADMKINSCAVGPINIVVDIPPLPL